MFYYTAKVLWFLATPSNLLPALGGLGVVLMLTRLRRVGLALAPLGTFGVLAAGLSPLVILPLEERFPAFSDDGADIAGIVVLGGAIEAEESLARAQLTVNEAGERVIALADLARRHSSARIVFSGGAGALLTDEPPEAEVLSRFAETLGVARERLVLENRSRSTRENALFSQALAAARPGERWLLVTSGWHMPPGRLPGHGLPGRLPHPRAAGPEAALRLRGERDETPRHRNEGVDRAPRLSACRLHRRAAARARGRRQAEPVDAAKIVGVDGLALAQDDDATLLHQPHGNAPDRLHQRRPLIRAAAGERARDVRRIDGPAEAALLHERQDSRLDLLRGGSHQRSSSAAIASDANCRRQMT